MKKIRVLIVDDSASIRRILTSLLLTDPSIEVVGTASDAFVAQYKIKSLQPDVLTLDVDMPGMNGLTFLEKLMAERPMPVVMVSALTETGCETTLRALELGAVDFFSKPKSGIKGGMEAQIATLTYKIKVAARAKVFTRQPVVARRTDAFRPFQPSTIIKTTKTIIAIGASTGGTEALRALLMALPPDFPPILIAQHMPEKVTKTFADLLNEQCRVTVKEAEDMDDLLPGHVLIAPGNYHMKLVRSGVHDVRYKVAIRQDARVNRHRPSVDVLFRSVATQAGKNAIGVILTGMGRDGADGIKEMKDAGAYTIAQDKSTSVIFGMPKEAIETGGVDEVCPLPKIAGRLIDCIAEPLAKI